MHIIVTVILLGFGGFGAWHLFGRSLFFIVTERFCPPTNIGRPIARCIAHDPDNWTLSFSKNNTPKFNHRKAIVYIYSPRAYLSGEFDQTIPLDRRAQWLIVRAARPRIKDHHQKVKAAKIDAANHHMMTFANELSDCYEPQTAIGAGGGGTLYYSVSSCTQQALVYQIMTNASSDAWVVQGVAGGGSGSSTS